MVPVATPTLEQRDQVQLKAGGPKMIITKVDLDKVLCIWTRKNGKSDERTFDPFVLGLLRRPPRQNSG